MTLRHASLLGLLSLLGIGLIGCAPMRWQKGQMPDILGLEPPAVEMPDDPPQAPPVIRSQSPVSESPYGPATTPGSPYSGNRYAPPSAGGSGIAGSMAAAAPGSDTYARQPMPVTDASAPEQFGTPVAPFQPAGQPAGTGGQVNAFQPPLPAPPAEAYQPGAFGQGAPGAPGSPWIDDPANAPQNPAEALSRPSDLDIFVEEARTGRFSFGVAVNSNAGLTGQITIEERNFDLFRLPRNWDDVAQGGAFRGGGQYLRIEAYPGNRLQRYMISLTEPYLFGTNISGTVSGSYFDRAYFDYFESRYGGTLGLGYRLTPDLSLQTRMRLENVTISNPRVIGVPELDSVLGQSDVYGGRVNLMHDTRDLPLAPTEGHYLELAFEQVFGTYDFSRAEIDYSQYIMLRERPDGSGRHVLAFNTSIGFLGDDAPLFENYFAGGYNTFRGFAFRGASPINGGVRVGGHFKFINSLEYFFPLTADDMVKGVVFCDYGTVEQSVGFHDAFRVSPGLGLRINVPALGPAPLALDFAFPVSKEATDQRQTFSFFFGVSRQ